VSSNLSRYVVTSDVKMRTRASLGGILNTLKEQPSRDANHLDANHLVVGTSHRGRLSHARLSSVSM
jgi:nucleotide-binding universal stress UspA family protein